MTHPRKSHKKSAHHTRTAPSGQIFDILRPGKAPAAATSKPVIVGHTSKVHDPMVADSGTKFSKRPFKHEAPTHLSPLAAEDSVSPSEAASASGAPAPTNSAPVPTQIDKPLASAPASTPAFTKDQPLSVHIMDASGTPVPPATIADLGTAAMPPTSHANGAIAPSETASQPQSTPDTPTPISAILPSQPTQPQKPIEPLPKEAFAELENNHTFDTEGAPITKPIISSHRRPHRTLAWALVLLLGLLVAVVLWEFF